MRVSPAGWAEVMTQAVRGITGLSNAGNRSARLRRARGWRRWRGGPAYTSHAQDERTETHIAANCERNPNPEPEQPVIIEVAAEHAHGRAIHYDPCKGPVSVIRLSQHAPNQSCHRK